ncbi:MAG: NAD(P)-binding domain-containing protein, partial [Candidatus Solibacter sp.]|nr:NAD(P)-binding domain-containing protein [Candidatus Solibacter sp.]
MVGLGAMGRNMLLNLADYGSVVAGYDNDPRKVEALQKEAQGQHVDGFTDIKEFVGALSVPRTIMMLVPAGPPVDSVIAALLLHLEKGDL